MGERPSFGQSPDGRWRRQGHTSERALSAWYGIPADGAPSAEILYSRRLILREERVSLRSNRLFPILVQHAARNFLRRIFFVRHNKKPRRKVCVGAMVPYLASRCVETRRKRFLNPLGARIKEGRDCCPSNVVSMMRGRDRLAFGGNH